MDNQLPFPLNTYSTDATNAPMLGQEFQYRGLKVLMVKAGAAFTDPAGKFILWSDPSEDANTVSGTATTLATAGTVAGLVPALLSGSITSNSYFFVIKGGKEMNHGGRNSVAIFSSAQTGAPGSPMVIISSGTCGISSGTVADTKVAVTRQINSSDYWLTSPGTFSAEVEVLL